MLQIHTQGHNRGALALSDHLPMEVAVVIAYSSPFSSYTKEHQSPALLPPRWLYSMPDFFCSVTTKQMCMSRRAQGPSSQITKVFYIDRGVLRQRGEGMTCQGFWCLSHQKGLLLLRLVLFLLSACRHHWCGCEGGPGDTSMDTLGAFGTAQLPSQRTRNWPVAAMPKACLKHPRVDRCVNTS